MLILSKQDYDVAYYFAGNVGIGGGVGSASFLPSFEFLGSTVGGMG
jgi:hypothetical protein